MKTTEDLNQTTHRPQLFKTGISAKPERRRYFKNYAAYGFSLPSLKEVLRARFFPVFGLLAVLSLLLVLLVQLHRLYKHLTDYSAPPNAIAQSYSSASIANSHPEQPTAILAIQPVAGKPLTNTPPANQRQPQTFADSNAAARNRPSVAAEHLKHKQTAKHSETRPLPAPTTAKQVQTTVAVDAVAVEPLPDLSVPSFTLAPDTALDADEEVLKAIIAHGVKPATQ